MLNLPHALISILTLIPSRVRNTELVIEILGALINILFYISCDIIGQYKKEIVDIIIPLINHSDLRVRNDALNVLINACSDL